MKLYVGNLSYQSGDSDLAELFGSYGEVISASVMKDKFTGRSRGFGFVEMTNDDEGNTAVETCNGMNFMGRNITVNEARPQEDRPRREFRGNRDSGGGGGYRGGGGGGNRDGGYRGGNRDY
jgi:cold-inducible RNA-binding protein